MAEERPRRLQPDIASSAQDDVLGKIDQLLNRHRSISASEPAAAQATTAPSESNTGGDGIPVLTDIVSGPGEPSVLSSARASMIDSAALLRRMAGALEAEQARLLTSIGNDPVQAALLERLVTELKRALPAAVRVALRPRAPGAERPGQ